MGIEGIDQLMPDAQTVEDPDDDLEEPEPLDDDEED